MIGIEAVMALMMQPAAFDTENVSTVSDEVQHQRALPMLCQSLQSVASYLGFRWRDDSESAISLPGLRRPETGARRQWMPISSLIAPGSGARSRPITCTGPGVSIDLGPDDGDPDAEPRRSWSLYQRPTIDQLREFQEQRLCGDPVCDIPTADESADDQVTV